VTQPDSLRTPETAARTAEAAARTAEAAALLAAAERDRVPVPPLTGRWPDLTIDDGYAIQRHNVARRVAAGARVVGHKVGLTSAAMQEMLGVGEPDFGHLLDDMVVAGEAEAAAYLAPRAEIEIAFVLRSALTGPGVTAADVLAATDHVRAAIEIIDSRIADWRIALVDTVADNASSAGVVLGERRVAPAGLDLAAVEGRLRLGGTLVERGPGAAVLGHPAVAVAWLANTLGVRGVALEAGHVVLPGACTRAVPVAPGDVVVGDFDGLGAVEVRFR
jgi:2-keto-4-pentenoate hydratase